MGHGSAYIKFVYKVRRLINFIMTESEWILILCLILFHWAVLTRSDKIACGKPGHPLNGFFKQETEFYSVNSTVDYDCSDGYLLFGSMNRSCNRYGIWDNEVPNCLPNDTSYISQILLKLENRRAFHSFNELFMQNKFKPQCHRVAEPGIIVSLRSGSTIVGFRLLGYSHSSTENKKFAITADIKSHNSNFNITRFAKGNGEVKSWTFRYHRVDIEMITFSWENTLSLIVCNISLFLKPDHYSCGTPDLPLNGKSLKVEKFENGSTKHIYACKNMYHLDPDLEHQTSCNPDEQKWTTKPSPHLCKNKDDDDGDDHVRKRDLIIGASIAGVCIVLGFALVSIYLVRKLKQISRRRIEIRRSQLPSDIFINLNGYGSRRSYNSPEEVPDILEEIYSRSEQRTHGDDRAVSHIYAEPNYDTITIQQQVINEIYSPGPEQP